MDNLPGPVDLMIQPRGLAIVVPPNLREIPIPTNHPKFSGSQHEDPTAHVERFEVLVSSLVTDSGHYLIWFPNTLTDSAYSWYRSYAPRTFTTWDQLQMAFLRQFRPETGQQQALAALTNIRQGHTEDIISYVRRFEISPLIDVLKYMVNKPQLSGRIARWVLLLQEFDFDVDVRPRKKHANADFLSRLSKEVNPTSIDDSLPDAHLFNVDVIPVEYADVLYYLKNNIFPLEYTDKQKQQLVYKMRPYTLIGEVLYKQGHDGILRRCINPSEVQLILKGCHDEVCGGHFAGLVTAQNALQSGYWWPTLFTDANRYAKRYDPCQRVGKPTPSSSMPLIPILAQNPFEK